MSGDRDTLMELRPALTVHNVNVISKIANKIPRQVQYIPTCIHLSTWIFNCRVREKVENPGIDPSPLTCEVCTLL